MIQQTILDLEKRIREATSLGPAQKEELQTLVNTLKEEIAASTEAGLKTAVHTFETEHPKLTMTANSLATYLSNLGI